MPTAMEEIKKMQALAIEDMQSNNPSTKRRGENTYASTQYEKSIVPQLVEGARIKLKTDDEYYQTFSSYDLSIEDYVCVEGSVQRKRTRYGVVVGDPCMRNGGGCIVVPVVLDGNNMPKVIDINGVEMVRPRKLAA